MDYFTKLSRRIFSVVIVLALVSSSALVAMAQDQDQAAPQDQGQYQDQGRDQDQAQGQDRDQDQYPDQEQDQGQPPYPDQDQRVTSPNQGANNQPPQQQDDPRNDPPSRAARLQFTSGSVSVQPHGTDDWVTGAINRPLTNSDNIWADKNSRAEINVGTGLIRIDSESSLTLTNIGENTVQLQLHQGAMNLHVRRLYDGETYEVDSPNQSFTVLKPGDYRFDVNPDADKTVITVWRGEGEAAGDGPAVRVRQHEQARFSNGSSMTNQIHAAPSPDAFDEWAQSRDDRFDRSASSRYVSPDVVGSEDLDEYGTWRDVPQYGNVWVPSRVDAGWAPYRNGHWIWVAPWGWTWVEDEPWGYAPFHYGRWVYYDNSWGWAPGPIYVRPYYSPALVAWFGGGGWGIGFGGGYGWCPLGFGEPFIPWYGVSRGYFNRVNITNTRITNINITNVYNNRYINRGGLHGGEPVRYANMHARNGFTAVSRETLVNSRSVARNNLRVSPNELSRISPTRSLDVRPTRTTMLGANAGRSAAVPPARSFARPVVSRNNSGAFHGGPNNTGRGGELSARDNTRAVQRPGENLPNRSAGPNSNVRMTDRGSADRGSAMPRSVPRPPNAGGSAPQVRTNDGRMNQGPTNTPRNEGSNSRGIVSAPRSNSNDAPRSNERSNDRSGGPRSELSVPRPMGNMSQGGYPSSAAANRGSYSSPSNNDRSPYGGGRRSPSYGGSYSRPSPSNGGGSYSRPAPSPAPSYDRGAYGRSAPAYGGGSNGGAYGRPAPSYGGGSYSRPAPSPAPSYDRGSYGRSAPAYGGGSARSAPSYGGGGRSSGGSYGGGGGRSSGGGGHASAPSHNSGGGGGSHSNNSDSRGRH